MDRVTLEGNVRQANARVVLGQQALRDQLAQVRELERWGLDASLAKSLLRIYAEQHAVSILDRRRLHQALASAMFDEPLPVQDNERDFLASDDTTYQRKAA